jgi:hypothetical protein
VQALKLLETYRFPIEQRRFVLSLFDAVQVAVWLVRSTLLTLRAT